MKYLSGSGLGYFYKKLMQELSNKAPSAHSHSWSSITGKPTTFTPSSHIHSISNITGLQGEIDALKKSVSDGKNLLATSITNKKVPTQSTDTFATMASNIDEIKLGSGNATVNDVLSGKTFSSDSGSDLVGIMANRDAWGTTINPGDSVTIPQGYHSGSGVVRANAYNVSIKSSTTRHHYQRGFWTTVDLGSTKQIKDVYARYSQENSPDDGVACSTIQISDNNSSWSSYYAGCRARYVRAQHGGSVNNIGNFVTLTVMYVN